MKHELIAPVFRENVHILRCPYCKCKMDIAENSLVCINGHCFDFAKEGYVNLLNHNVKTGYNKKLFLSRKSVTLNGFFKPLLRSLVQNIADRITSGQKILVLDAGCGEGTLFTQIVKMLAEKNCDIVPVGLDISKEGIKLAAKNSSHSIFLAGDIANIPLMSSSADLVLNILSPANYSQFKSVLKPGGTLIKVIPGVEYLRELRTAFNIKTNNQDPSQSRVIQIFSKHFAQADINCIKSTFIPEREGLQDILNMTPLLWNVDECKRAETARINHITLDFLILAGNK